MTGIQGPDGHIKNGGYVTTPGTTTTARVKPQQWIHTTTSKIEVTQNKDGSFTESKTTTDGAGTTTQNTTYEFDANGNKIIKSVSTETAEFYGSHKKVEYVDKDGDGYADYKIETSINPKGKPVKTKFKGKPDNSIEMNKRNMAVLSGDKSKVVWGTEIQSTSTTSESDSPSTTLKDLHKKNEETLKQLRANVKIEQEFQNDEDRQIEQDRKESIQNYQTEDKEAKLAEYRKLIEHGFNLE